jgi:hypothetical protein
MTNKLQTMKEEKKPEIYTNEFSSACYRYYKLWERLQQRQAKMANMAANEPGDYAGHSVNELDKVINYYRRAQELHRRIMANIDDMKKAGERVLAFLKHFKVPPVWPLVGIIEDVMEYEVWCDNEDNVYVLKIRDHNLTDNPNIMVHHFVNGEGSGGDIDDDLEEPKEDADRAVSVMAGEKERQS